MRATVYRQSGMIGSSNIGYLLVSTLAKILPRRLTYLLGETLALVCFLLCAGRRRNLLRNLKVVLPRHNWLHLRRVALGIMLNFGRSVAETFMIPHLSQEEIDSKVSIVGKPYLPYNQVDLWENVTE